MSITAHSENRAWAFQALDEVQAFLQDPDFEGTPQEETVVIERKRKELRDNKYRVVILGAFNVGKSAMINAFLGDEYLPMVLEECTTKITHIIKADAMTASLVMTAAPSPEELESLANLMKALNVGATVAEATEANEIRISYATTAARDLLKSLRPLVTVSADDDFPHLKSLRGKFDEIYIHLPTDLLEEDIALVDSPGVHSISETNKRIAQEIIPNSHLVCCLVDSQYAGNEQNRSFIESVAGYKHRKMFFVINKADQLNSDEIDPRGHAGPAKDLLRSLAGIVDNPELFFVSSLYALVAQQLEHKKIDLADIDQNNKIKVPFAIQRRLLESDDPAREFAAHLMEQSNITALKTRLLEYLYSENREGAIVESVCRFLDTKTWSLTRPLQIKLDLARDVPRLLELGAERERLTAELKASNETAERALGSFKAMAAGEKVDGTEYKGYEALVGELVNEKAVKEQVLDPLGAWLRVKSNFAKAKKDSYAPLKSEVENKIDALLQNAGAAINAEVDSIEDAALDMAGTLRRDVGSSDRGYIEPARGRVGTIKAGLACSYFAYMLVGGAVLAGAGAALVVAGMAPQIDINIGAAAGAAAGVLLGIILRAVTARCALRKKLNRIVGEKVNQILMAAPKNKSAQVASVRDQLNDLLAKRRAAFADALQFAFDKDAARLKRELATVADEEDALKQKQRELLDRIEPKLEKLLTIGQKASEIAKANAPAEEAFSA
jgi:GTPase Era involved in 16S rRNA processing